MAAAPSPATDSHSRPEHFTGIYWVANWMELVERFAYYGVRVVLPVMMVKAVELGYPGFDHEQKGAVYAAWALVQSLLPIFTGGFADRFGYKSNIAVATTLKIVGYLLMGFCIKIAEVMAGTSLVEARAAGTDQTYLIFFIGSMFLAAGTAIFKPGLQGLIAHQMPKGKSALGWAMFYQMVNIGGFIGPMVAGYMEVLEWSLVYIVCTVGIALNYLPLFFFKEPDHHGADEAEGPMTVLARSFRGLVEPRLFFFTISFAGFWLMFYQLFDILPNFIDDWIDSRASASFLEEAFTGWNALWLVTWIAALGAVARYVILRKAKETMGRPEMMFYGILAAVGLILTFIWNVEISVPKVNGGNMTQAWMINSNALWISFFAFLFGYLTNRMTALRAIVFGIAVSAVAIYGLGMSMSGWWCLGAIAVFSVGEMMASPTKMRYLASIAPPGKEGLYMGYVNFTVGIGWSIGSLIAGIMYERGGDKVNLAKRYLVDNHEGNAAVLNEMDKSAVLPHFESVVGVDAWETRDLLWNAYEPQSMWLVFALIGLASMIGIVLYNRAVSGAKSNPQHVFNTMGQKLVTGLLVPISIAFWWGAYILRTDFEQKWTAVAAPVALAVLFTGMLAVSILAPPDRNEQQGLA